MPPAPAPDDGCSAWSPGVASSIPRQFRPLETLFRGESTATPLAEVELLAERSGLPPEELVAFRAERLALHELIVRVTAGIAIPEGVEEEDFGHEFRRVARRIHETDIVPRLPGFSARHAELVAKAESLARELLARSLFAEDAAPRRAMFHLSRRSTPTSRESVAERDYRIVSTFKSAGLACDDELERATYKALYRVCGAMLARHGRVAADAALLAQLAARQVGNELGSRLIGREIDPLVAAAIVRDGYRPVVTAPRPVLISLKGASAAGKSSLRPMLRRVMHEHGIPDAGYGTISPDIWRRLLLDYDSLGVARKYAGHLTSRELLLVDGKLDRYIRARAERDNGIAHLVVDRFRFDSFSGEQVARVLHNTYARHVATMVMYFIVTPPEETVERGWRRALERGRYKSVEDFLGHAIEAYTGMPKLFFKWLAYLSPEFRYAFLDNRVPKGQFPTTIARGNQDAMLVFDPIGLVNIERYQKINLHARAANEVYPSAEAMEPGRNLGFLREILRRVPRVEFAAGEGAPPYLSALNGSFTVLDPSTLAKALTNPELAAVLTALAPQSVTGSRA